MPVIKSFRGIYYNQEAIGGLGRVVAPPYDVIKEEQARALLGRSPYNVMRLILGNTFPAADFSRELGQTSGVPSGTGKIKDPYSLAGQTYSQWRKRGVLRRQDKPAIYAYYLGFQQKTTQGLIQKTRKGFVALVKLAPYSEGSILPHERTLSAAKEDRLKLLKAIRTNLSQIFMLYSDPEQEVYQMLDEAVEGLEPWRCEDDLSVVHRMWPVQDERVVNRICESFVDKTLYIADGHHRYETCLAYLEYMKQNMPLYTTGADYTMVYLTAVEDPGLVIFPYHRLIHSLPKTRLKGLKKRLAEIFNIKSTLLNPMEMGQHRREFIQSLTELGRTELAFGLVEAAGGAYYLTLRPDAPIEKESESSLEAILRRLDVVVLEDLILTGILGINRKALFNEKYVRYETDFDKILDQLQRPDNQLAFLLNPIPAGLVTRVARGRGIMPEKSTYFFPKVITGLVMNEMD